MKLTELGAFTVILLFVAGMTYQHNQQVNEQDQAAKTLEQVLIKQERDRETESKATKVAIRHDQDESTNTVFISLDASSSFDAGNAANQIYFNRYVPDKTKPICAKYEENCNSRKCDCIEIQLDECGDEMYEPLCGKYEEDCNPKRNEDCRCLDYLEVLVEYTDDCEYQVLDHSKRQSYLKSKMNSIIPKINQKKQYEPDTDLTYMWEQVSGPSSDINKFSKQSSMVLELGEGEYVFKCTVTDKYGAKDVGNHRIIVTREANNPPEVNIKGAVLLNKPK